MGYRSTTAQLFTVPPNMAAFVTVLVTAYYSDKLTNAVRYAGTFLVAIGVFQGSPMIMAWIANNVTPHYVRNFWVRSG
jgi:sugar phosphate permease